MMIFCGEFVLFSKPVVKLSIIKIIIFPVFLAFFMAGCTAINDSIPDTSLKKAKDNIKDDKLAIAIAQLINTRDQSANKDVKAESTFRLGECYFKLKSYYDAKKEFEKCLADFPNSKWDDECHDYLNKIKVIYEDKDSKLKEDIALAQKKISEIEGDLKGNYNKAALHIELGNTYWSIGQYAKAGKEYLTAINLNNQLRKDPIIKERLIFDLDGNLIPIKPENRVQLEAEKNPIIFFNLYNSLLRDRKTGTQSMYVVTGQIKNQSLRPILDLTIDVTLFNVSGNVLDVTRVFVGKIFPGEVRSFSAISQPLENVHNVTRYECKAFYDH